MKKILFSLGLLSFMVAGCAGTGSMSIKDETRDSIRNKITNGMSINEVRVNLGEPTLTSNSNEGNLIWTYEFMSSGAKVLETFMPVIKKVSKDFSVKKKQLVILFDQNNRVKKYTLSDNSV